MRTACKRSDHSCLSAAFAVLYSVGMIKRIIYLFRQPLIPDSSFFRIKHYSEIPLGLP